MLTKVEFDFFTSPTPGVPSINSPADAEESAKICLPHLLPLLPNHDAFLVACYSQHPLVDVLREECSKVMSEAKTPWVRKYVLGIFEASLVAGLSLISDQHAFGIVSTGKVWEAALDQAVRDFMGAAVTSKPDKFAGCETTGLNATELHELPAEQVQAKMMEATKRLLDRGEQEKGVQAICLGCAGMVGLEECVRQACIDEYGLERGKTISIIDGVKAGVSSLVGLAKSKF